MPVRALATAHRDVISPVGMAHPPMFPSSNVQAQIYKKISLTHHLLILCKNKCGEVSYLPWEAFSITLLKAEMRTIPSKHLLNAHYTYLLQHEIHIKNSLLMHLSLCIYTFLKRCLRKLREVYHSLKSEVHLSWHLCFRRKNLH